MFIIFLDLRYKTDLQNVLNISLDICNKKKEKVISLWHVFILILMISCYMIIPRFLDINAYYKYVIILIIIIGIYYTITKSTEQNCVRGFNHQIETLFLDHDNICISSK